MKLRARWPRLADEVFLVRAGREKSVAATKTYTGQVLMLYLLAYALGGADPARRSAATARLGRVRAAPGELASPTLSERYRFMEHAVVVGRGLNYANAFEFALKMMETSYVVAERFSSADFLHGPIAMVEASFPVFLFAPSGVTAPSMRQMLDKLRSLEAETVVITDAANREIAEAATRSIRLREQAGGVVYSDPLHHSGAAFRRLPGRAEGPRSGQSTHADQGHAHDVMVGRALACP